MSDRGRLTRTAKRHHFALALATAALSAGASWPAYADPPSAADLQASLRQWFAQVMGTEKAAPPALAVNKDGDAYRIVVPVPGLTPGVTGDAAGLTAKVHPLDGGRWAIDGMTLPSPSTITIKPPPGGLKDGGLGLMRLRIGQQTATGVFDPSYATGSRLDATLDNVHTDVTANGLRQTQDYADYIMHMSLSPHPAATAQAPATLDAAESAAIHGLHVTSSGLATFDAVADTVELAGTATDVDPNRVGAVFAATFRYAAAIMSGGSARPGQPLPIDRTTLRSMVAALAGLAGQVEIKESLSNLKVIAGGSTVSLGHAEFGMGGASKAGLLTTYLDFAVDRLGASNAPPSIRAYLPRHLHIHPTLSGVGTAEVIALLHAALAPDTQQNLMGAAVLGLFAHGGIKIGLDDLAIDLGDSSLTASGSVDVPAPVPAVVSGKAEVVARQLDTLIGHLQSDPQAAQIIGVLMMAKALGRSDGDRVIWDIAYHGGAVQVNGHTVYPPEAQDGGPAGDPGGAVHQ
ncbi:YdgA family protein [Acidisphaera rubrifaciens]|uniref:Uncharacterized protein n=1 Tax=Acidisphaera rubrifaciens HS-AP3 TaxID=1231350 RepID=A0A0D6P5U4_9PROT|nr:hypothetical protein [Acidisphaera rubrifaciens]GAN76701.1 hypothetical protein Asru_0143_25 [Acidisphaera rubrifaciens HS-AP3]